MKSMTADSDRLLPAFLLMYAIGYCPTSLSGNLRKFIKHQFSGFLMTKNQLTQIATL